VKTLGTLLVGVLLAVGALACLAIAISIAASFSWRGGL
jgi:hypothetical protein